MTKTSSDKKKISANCLFNKGLVSRIYKEFSKYNGKKKKSNQRKSKDMKKHVTEDKSAYEKTYNITSYQGKAN